MRVLSILVAIGLCAVCTPSYAAAPPVEAYANMPQFTDLEVAPGGRYLAARANIGNVYRLIVIESGDHHLSLYEHRLRYLQETERFLNECIGPSTTTAQRQ